MAMARDIFCIRPRLTTAMMPSLRPFLLLILLSLWVCVESADPGFQKTITTGSKFGFLGRGPFGGIFQGQVTVEHGSDDPSLPASNPSLPASDPSLSASNDGGSSSSSGGDQVESARKMMNSNKGDSSDHTSHTSQDATPVIGPDGNPILSPEKPRFESNSLGKWRITTQNAGISAMQLQTMPEDKVVWFDTTFLGPSALELKPKGNCPINFETNVPDCYAHALEYDGLHDTTRPLTIKSDPWCSVGSLSATGTLVGSGGYYKGRSAIRLLKPCPNCDFTEKSFVLGSERWYASQHILEDGNLVIVGGRKSFNYEIIPPDTFNIPIKKFDFPFLQQTTDPVENNLYPFLYLVPDGNLFLFANNRSIIFDPKTAKIIRELPPLAGGSRNYPASGMSAVLPIKIDPKNPEKVYFDIMVCGGASPFAFFPVDSVQARPKPKNVYWPALQDCNKIKLMDPNPHWEKDMLLSPRVMGDMLILPTGDLLILNGAKKGAAGWWNGDDPNLTPELYMPKQKLGSRFKQLHPTTIPRMYHSTSAVLSNGEVLVAGSNENDRYVYQGVPFPTELRVEKFTPPYLDKSLDKHRPKILTKPKKVKHGGPFSFKYAITTPPPQPLEASDLKMHMLSPPFTTHGYSQQQRMLVLDVRMRGPDTVQAVAPPNARIAPPGYYILFLVHRGVPSAGIWVRLVTK
uniref:Galactose oxidase-like Early set domain-containing protein n=3 Tax=Daucus carota subsp. sativus TaxID=79200 RepID=A0A164TIF8_DAUCS|nr:PREDICTED: aldehyde oxidase GLOX1 [Daucus carota subsp. sativus]